jgi:hypothetical protein
MARLWKIWPISPLGASKSESDYCKAAIPIPDNPTWEKYFSF